MKTEIQPYVGNEERIIHAVETIAAPVVQTLSPKGGNVMIPLSDGRVVVSNDGITIAKSINLEDDFENNIVQMIKEASLRTNSEAGDGTTTSILLTSVLIREGMKMRRDGMNPVELIEGIKRGGNAMLKNVQSAIQNINGNEDLRDIALISSNNNSDIADKVVETMDVVGLDGMVFIDVNKKPHDELQKDIGYVVKAGMLRPEMQGNDGRGYVVSYENVPVLVTDKKLYYKEEAEVILNAVYAGGWPNVVIIARDFIGEFPNVMLANHRSLGGKFGILLVKDPFATDGSSETLEDLACYLDSQIISEKNGSLIENIKTDSFKVVNRVFADGLKTVIQLENNNVNPNLTMRVSSLRAELDKDKENDSLKMRISSLTAGMVKILVGAPTPAELQERLYRYEDAINATRAAMRSGYVAGGGITLFNSYKPNEIETEFKSLFKKYSEAPIRQIAKNCGRDADTVLENIVGLQEDLEDKNIGYEARDGSYVNMIDAGVIDPADVLKLAIENSISAATNILSVNYFLTQIKEDGKDK